MRRLERHTTESPMCMYSCARKANGIAIVRTGSTDLKRSKTKGLRLDSGGIYVGSVMIHGTITIFLWCERVCEINR